jgi:long-chain acyl-CoA synthetase
MTQGRRTTLFEMLLDVRDRFGSRDAFVYRAARGEFTVPYEKFFEDVVLLARGLRSRGVRKGAKVLLLSDNRYEWIVTDLALMSLGAVDVPRGTDTPAKELEFIIRHSGATFLIFETADLLRRHTALVQGLPHVEGIFVIHGEDLPVFSPLASCYNEILLDRTLGKEEIDAFVAGGLALAPDDLVTIIYTSGTTGTPKGVMLNHRNLMYQVNALPACYGIVETDLVVSILPSWHIFERALEYVVLSCGGCLVYSSIKTFAADLEKYRPTLLVTVPRLWESLYARITSAIEKEGGAKARLFPAMVRISRRFRKKRRLILDQLPDFGETGRWLRLGRKAASWVTVTAWALFYPLAQHKLAALRAKFGGRLRLAVSGGGSLPVALDEWLDAVGVPIFNAYGMTECAPAIAGRTLATRVFGTIGRPFPGTELKLCDEGGREVPDGAEGEICVRGAQVMPGYYDNPEENARSFTADGFLRTGDLGRRALSGDLVITGRSKDIIVLASGENVDPTRIEGAITMFPFVKDAVLVGQDRKGLGALIVPEEEQLRDFVRLKMTNIDHEAEDLMEHPHVLDRVKSELNKRLHPDEGFHPHERLHRIAFLKREFTPGEEVTNTFKKRRHNIERRYREIINRLFHEGDAHKKDHHPKKH